MTNNTKKFLITTIFLATLLLSSVYASFIPKAQAIETAIQQKGLTILDEIVNLDLAKYVTTEITNPPTSFRGTIPSENLDYKLESNNSKIKLSCTFTNGSLHILQVLERDGNPILTKSATNEREMAKAFLSDYQRLTGKAFYGELSSTLNSVADNKNSTIIFGNVRLEVINSENGKTFSWSYTFNGINAASKCVSLTYKDGFLKSYVDTWNLYKVGSTKVSLSEEEAVVIAMEKAKVYSWNVVDGNDTIEINNFRVTKAAVKHLVFCNSINADNERGDDRLMLYPMWRIGVELDKYYPGDVYGIYVDIWADTKEIRNIQEAVSTILPFVAEIATIEESTGRELNSQAIANANVQNLSSTSWLVLIALACTMLIGPIWIRKNKNLSKRYYRIAGVLLCVLMFAAMISMISTVKGDIRGRSTIWGSEATYKTPEELAKQDLICFYTNNWFTWSSYLSTDNQGPNTLKWNLLPAIESDEATYQCVATVWFDHGPGAPLDFPGHPDEWHFRLCDSSTTANPNGYIYDFEIFDRTYLGKTYFAFISVCASAQLDLINHNDGSSLGNGVYGNDPSNFAPIGMPYAWTHGAYLDTTGYETPDLNSPYCYIGFHWGSAALDQEVDPINYPGVKYYDWVFSFFAAALNQDKSVNDALDHASYYTFSPQSFGATILHTGFTAHWPGSPDPPAGSCRMEVYGNGNIHLQYPVNVQAYDNYGSYVLSDVTIDDFASYGTTYGWVRAPPGTHTVGVQNNPDAWRTFNYFDGYSQGTNPISVNINSRPTVIARYDNSGPPLHWIYLDAWNYYGGEKPYPGVYIDDMYVGTVPVYVQVTEGWHKITVDDPYGWMYLYEFSDGYGNGEYRPIYSNVDITAWYIG